MARRITYQGIWENDFSWVKEGKLPGYAKCVICKKDNIFFGSMGRTALKSHEQGKKHKELEQNFKLTTPIKTWLQTKSSQDIMSLPSTSAASHQQQLSIQPGPACSDSSTVHPPIVTPSTISKAAELKEKWWLEKDNVTKAEILWCVHTCLTHQSLRNAEASVNLFKIMFPDSSIAIDMKLGKDKTSYSIVYGLAPYFRKTLLNNINSADYYIIGFDESLNKYSQKQQLDISIRFWNENSNEVSCRYLSSVFLTESKANDLLNGIKDGLSGLDWRKIVQVSMDGPNVNIKLVRTLKKEIEECSSDNHQLLDIGSCGLHVLNVAFKTGIQKTAWNLIEFLRACYYLFKDCPSRRGVFTKVTKSSTFPLKFCSIRWLENSAVAKRALDVLDNLKKYVEHVKTDKTQKSIRSSKSFKTVQSCLEDKLLRAKLAFFFSLAQDIEPFLRQFQSDYPMAPFIHGDLLALLNCLMGRVVKEEVLTSQPLKSIDVNTAGNLKSAKIIDLGYAAKREMRKVSNLKDVDVLQFRQECRTCLTVVVSKMLDKCPLKYELTEAITFLNPKEITVSNTKVLSKNLTKALEILEESNLISVSCAQKADREFHTLIADASVLQEAKDYSRETRLDSFWVKILAERQGENLKKVIKILLPLSHGNATLERGFSVNGDLVVENLSEESLIAQRLIYDSIHTFGGIGKLVITKDLILSARNSNQRWKEALKTKREKLDAETRAKAEKRKLDSLAKELEEQKKKLMMETAKDVAKIEEQIKELKKQC